MKVVTYRREGQERLGFVVGAEIVDPLLSLGRDAPQRAHFVPAKGYLKPGDVIESEPERIGVLRNVVGFG